MHLIVGLGNPGEKYKNNRHNIGFMVVDALHELYNGEPFKHKFHGDYAQINIGNKKVMLLKPDTFMNRSGIAVGECAHFYKIPLNKVIVVHDDLDLELGRIKVKIGGSHAGHNGLKSVDAFLGNEYLRLRFGISHPGERDRVADYVLNDFAKSEAQDLGCAVKSIARFIEQLLAGDLPKFMNSCALAMKEVKLRKIEE